MVRSERLGVRYVVCLRRSEPPFSFLRTGSPLKTQGKEVDPPRRPMDRSLTYFCVHSRVGGRIPDPHILMSVTSTRPVTLFGVLGRPEFTPELKDPGLSPVSYPSPRLLLLPVFLRRADDPSYIPPVYSSSP